MESSEEIKYKVVITFPAEVSFYEILDYLFDNYTYARAEQMANKLRETAKSLHQNPDRGSIEQILRHRKPNYRYILYQRTSRADIKIIYYIDHLLKTVYITDFFPTEMNPKKLLRRN